MTEWLAGNSGTVLAVLLPVFVLLAAALILLAIRHRALAHRWHGLLDGAEGKALEQMLHEHLKRRIELEEEVTEIRRRLDSLESRMATSKRYVGLVRYDAFPDVGGEQSFALAVYDERGHGVVITSLVGRTDCRVYCKELVEGKGQRDLSDEEQRAIREAGMGRAKPGASA